MRLVRTAPGGSRRAEHGHAIDVDTEGLTPATLRAAVSGDTDSPVAVDCPSPSRWWPKLAVPTDDTPPLDRLVAAARSRGVHVPEERALAAAQKELADLTVERADPAETRKRLAAAGTEVESLREEVAAARGRIQARRNVDADTEAAEEALADDAARLAEAETERVAAEQAHETAERQARRARSTRERRLQRQDRVANRHRDARRALVDAIASPFAEAVEAVPGESALSTTPLGVDGDAVTAALAAVKLADLRAPVVDGSDRFGSAAAASECLAVPVIRC